MTLRRRLVLLHSAFALFAVLTALATIYAVQVYTEGVANRLEVMFNEAKLVEDLRVDLKRLDVHLHELVLGRRSADTLFDSQREALLARLDEAVRYTRQDGAESEQLTTDLRTLREQLSAHMGECLALVRADRLNDALRVFKADIETNVIEKLDQRLRRLRGMLDARRGEASSLLFARNAQLLMISALVAVGGVALVVAGAIVVRRRLVTPIARLNEATNAFARGDLLHRVSVSSADELGVLAGSLNHMASSLRSSQLKFKSLFENQRDAVVVCDRSGIIRECHDGDTGVLGVAAQTAIGRPITSIWSHAGADDEFWLGLVNNVFTKQATVRAPEVKIPGDAPVQRYVDIVAYPVDYADEPFVAFVLRDASERMRLQQELRRADTMEAAVTVARGIAHDFKNLLHSAVNTLSSLADDAALDPEAQARARSALAACDQAASLSRRLSRFAGSDRGSPERIHLLDTVQMILDSLDDAFRASVDMRLDGDRRLDIEIDRDHLTQIVLNLLINAREAMPAGGVLRVDVRRARSADPRSPGIERDWVVLSIADTGCGIAPDAVERIFQPFYSSKQRGEHGPRGLGLAVVYALVNHARGFIRVHSELGAGSRFSVHFPPA